MTKQFVTLALSIALFVGTATVHAQEATIHHGFLFFAGEKYAVDEEIYGIYDDGNLFEDLIKENAAALDQFKSYRAWHITANVFTSFSFAAIVFGAVCYMPGVDKHLEPPAGIIGFASGGGLLVLGMVFEFIAWGSITGAAETYNKELIDEGPSLKLNGMPTPTLALAPGGGHFALTWRF
ncbi:MAG: hypothetical protein JRJ87_25425 [Deltaproteobacteria bacterium]|nr:hypothetical protein [Deltaproteobacteria bacterium]